MMIFQRALDALTAFVKRWSWADPSIVLFGLLIASRHACDTGAPSDGTIAEYAWRWAGGSVGARSGLFVCGLMHWSSALAERNDRSSRKNSCAFLPQRTVR